MPECVSTTTPTVHEPDASQGRSGTKFRLQLVIVNESGHEQLQEVARIEREGVEMETLGLTLAEGKLILKKIQEGVVQEQIQDALARRRALPGVRSDAPQQGPSRRHRAHSVWEHRVKEPAAGTLPVPAACEKTTLEQASEQLHVSHKVVRRLIESGKIAATQIVPWAPWEISADAIVSEEVLREVKRVKRGTRVKIAVPRLELPMFQEI